MYEEWFQEVQLHVVELPIEFFNDLPHYTGYIKELPFINGVGSSKKELYRDLARQYQAYVEAQRIEAEQEEQTMTSSLLSLDQLLKYYDGETFDGFSIELDNEER